MTVSRHLARLGYKNSLPLKMPMLTVAHKCYDESVCWSSWTSQVIKSS